MGPAFIQNNYLGGARRYVSAPDLYALTDAGAVTAPGSLDDPDFGLTLNVHMAALVAVEAYPRGAKPPTEPHELDVDFTVLRKDNLTSVGLGWAA